MSKKECENNKTIRKEHWM